MPRKKRGGLKGRAEAPSSDKSALETLADSLNRLSAASGLENAIECVLDGLRDACVCANPVLFYRMNDEWSRSDAHGASTIVDTLDDVLVRAAFDIQQPAQGPPDRRDSRGTTADCTADHTCAFPLLAGSESVGVIRVENLRTNARELFDRMRPFFGYAAQLLEKEIVKRANLTEVPPSGDSASSTLAEEIRPRERAEEAPFQAESKLESRAAAQTEEELRRVNRTLRALSDCNQAVIRAEDESELLKEVCRVVISGGEYRAAWVGYADSDSPHSVRLVAQAGFEPDAVKTPLVTWDDTETGEGPIRRAVRTGAPCLARFDSDSAAPAFWLERLGDDPPACSLSLPLIVGGKTLGALTICSDAVNAFDAKETGLLTEMAGNLSYGVSALRTRVARAEVESDLQLFRQLTDELNDAIFVLDPQNSRVLDVNDAASRLLGYSRAELLNMRVVDFDVDVSTASDWTARMQELRAVGAQTVERRHRRQDGAIIPVELSVRYTVQDQTGYVIALVRDITERKQVEDKMLRSDQRLRLHRELSPLGFLEWDEDFRAVEWNAGCERIFGYTREEAIGRHAKELILPEEVHELVDGIYQSLMNQTGGQHSINKNVTKDGRAITCEWFNTTLIDKNGRAIGVASVCSDITERKQAERERQSHLRFFECMDRVNRAIQGTGNPEQMMSDVLDVVLEVFDCDRAWFVYPCDPEASAWCVPMERTRPEYPGAAVLGLDYPVTADVVSTFNAVLASDDPVPYGPGAEQPIPDISVKRFGVQSQLGMALYPTGSKPYMVGLHQCSRPRVWTIEESRLFRAIGRRLADALTILLSYRELRESEARLRDAQRIAKLGNWEWDVVENKIWWSEEVYRIFDIPPAEFGGTFEAFISAVHPEDRERVEASVRQALEHDTSNWQINYRVARADGTICFVHEEAETVFDPTGRPLRRVGAVQDVTERERAERLLAENERRFRLLYECAPLAYQSLDGGGNILEVNPAWLSLLGRQREDVIGKWIGDFLTPESRLLLGERFKRFLAAGEVHGVEFDFIRANGDNVTVSVDGLIARDKHGVFKQTHCILHDITERKQAERRIVSQLQEKELLVREIHHRVKNNMQVISSLLDLQVRQSGNRELRELLTASRGRIRTMAMVHERLYTSQDMTRVNLKDYVRALVAESLTLYGVAPDRVDVRVDVEQWALAVGTAIPCGLIIYELLSNALRHAFPADRTGRVDISLRRAGDGLATLIVRDDGVGVPVDLDFDTTDSLGLRLVRILAVDQLGGTVKVERNGGTTVQVRFPEANK